MARASAAGIKRHTLALREQIAEDLLPGAGRVIGNVIARDARERCVSDEVRPTIKVRVERSASGIVRVFIETRGPGAYRAPWLEYGTDPHEIGLRNLRPRKQALRIGDRYVTAPVRHPGAQSKPFLRPAFDQKQAEAFAAGQRFLTRGSRGLDTEAGGDDE